MKLPVFVAALSLTLGSLVFSQGNLTPPGAPGPTMKSLQEIWDTVQVQQQQISALQVQNAQIQQQNAQIQQQNVLLLESHGVSLPWQRTTVDSAGSVGQYTSLAFTPGGQPAISYWDQTIGDLKYAVFNGTTWTLSTVDSTGSVGQYSSLAFTPDGRPAISYYDITNGDLKYAVKAPFTNP